METLQTVTHNQTILQLQKTTVVRSSDKILHPGSDLALHPAKSALLPDGGSIHSSAHFDDLFSRAESDRNLPQCTVTDHSDLRHPALVGLAVEKRSIATRSHSMRDQTSHTRDKYQGKHYNQMRRSSTKNSPSPMTTPTQTTPTQNQSRNNSLPSEEGAVITRQFLATNKKVINRGDSFKRKEKPPLAKSRLAEQNGSQEFVKPKQKSPVKLKQQQGGEVPLAKVYSVALLGHSAVGKTSIIDQFMSSDHADVYRRETDDKTTDTEVDLREVSVDVNGEESILGFLEPSSPSYRLEQLVQDHSPDCYVVVYAVDDTESLGAAKSSLAWLVRSGAIPSRPCILTGNKIDLARTRVVSTQEGMDVAVQYGTKFLETSPGMGHHIDELLVGIVMQLRLRESGLARQEATNIKSTVKGLFNKLTGKDDEKRKLCRNLNI